MKNLKLGLLLCICASLFLFGCGGKAQTAKWQDSGYSQGYPSASYQAKASVPATRPPRPQINTIPLDDMNLGAIQKKIKASGGSAEDKLIDSLVNAGANCMDDNAIWVDSNGGKKIYDILKSANSNIVVSSLSKFVCNNVNRKRVLFLSVKLGIPGSQNVLNGLLYSYGDKQMAEDFLNCGSNELYEGGKEWGRRNGYCIQQGPGSHRCGWGRF